MKKFLGLILAVAMVAAGIAPAMAADVELSGEVRVRHEIKNNYIDLSDSTGDGTNETTQRTRLNAKVAVDDQTTAYISIQDARTWGEETNTATTANEDDNIDLSQAYLQIENAIGPVGVKIGRQVLSYGDQRVVGGFEWSDNARRFDALKLMYGNDTVSADLFLAEVDEGGTAVSDAHLNGLYVTVKNVVPANTLDLYALQETSSSTEQDMKTLGIRLAGKAAGADWTAEYASQTGDKTATQDKDADMMAITAGYTLADVLGGLRIGGEYFSVSGQEAGSADDTDFENGYATNHFHYGISDYVNANVDGVAVKLSAKPMENLSVAVEYWMMEENESGTAGVDEAEYDEINVQIKYGLTEKVKLYVYAASVDVEPAGGASTDDVTKVGVQLHAMF